MKETTNKYLLSALLIGVIFHSVLILFTLENTYDALIHMFFANHYANSWWEPWSYSWYTGFTVMGYPPLAHQAIALFSYIGGLKFGLFSVAIIGVILFITGAFRFTLLLTGNRTVAGYASIIAVFSSSFVETLHIFGQLPSIIGISVLMHAMPEIYLWLRSGRKRYLFTSLSLIAVTVTSHHVTPIFGMIFFIFPLIGMAVMDGARDKVNSYKEVTLRLFFKSLFGSLKRIILFGGSSLFLIVFCILPYWVNSKKNPITQVPIPHGSRDNFIEVTSSGLMFFIIPWGIILFLLPYIFYRYFSKRYIFFGLSLALLTVLGTGGTTPIPLKILGETAFNILTLDRFTLWGSIMSLPMMGEFVYRLSEGDLKETLQKRFGTLYHRIVGGLFAGAFLFMAFFTVSLGYFRPFQPQKINMLPIVNFLSQDQHDKWRFLPLGFGDQMAYLSTQTNAMTVDGNYHSARRLPELTSRAVERLENSKFRGLEGIGSLQQFLTVPEKYNLKYVFSNDKFYDPILYFCGWHRLSQLENGLMVWEKLNVQPLPKTLPKDEVPVYLKLMWGIIPLLTVVIAFFLNIQLIWLQALKTRILPQPAFFKYSVSYNIFSKPLLWINKLWIVIVLIITGISLYFIYLHNASQVSAKNVVKAYYDALDFKEFNKAYSYIVPDENYPVSQFLLEFSVSDGILNSYGKIDGITIEMIESSSKKVKLKAKIKWITPLEIINTENIHSVEKIKGKWYIVPNKKDPDIPPDQFISDNKTLYYKQGRRRVTTQQTHHEDVLKQPELEILSAKLIQYNNEYMIIGEIQNIDNIPADVVLKATLYDKYNNKVATFNAKNVIKHKLLPKEVTGFKVNFEDIAWIDKTSVKPETFNPDEYAPATIDSVPQSFNIQSAGNVATKDLYTDVSITNLKITDNKLTGTLYNFGLQEVTVPELLVSYYNENKELIYIDHFYIEEGVRIQRKQHFTYPLLDLTDTTILNESLEKCFVNGLQNKELANTIVPDRINEHQKIGLQKVDGKGYSYIKTELNNFIGNPR
ncbi:hypothetical protein DVK85_00945 [Flavobacterium arcticum]|uniref:Uncharacterized protein n=1 Tax=Flavobacterium arcticum TaxID=1784713 RepID=A0A345H8G2_9FLAO|nr:hypothetical protein [Flavobacterium arcticum]AXG72872.1 hypothetical protein DVK85_00945 [Flavobacterium arcticum]KAF2510464.1 hypothetical protein E0W72_08260 [Flavobacterium arcticum]